jgi:hypothetical protein
VGRLGTNGPPEERIDLPTPIPVYLVYFTASPSPGGPLRADIYRRDPPLLRLAARRSGRPHAEVKPSWLQIAANGNLPKR